MKNKEKYDLRDISYDLEVDRGGYDFVIYYTSMEIYREFFSGSVSTCSTFTKWLEEDDGEEYKPQILTDKEKAYLSAIIKPFGNKKIMIGKLRHLFGEEEYIWIDIDGYHFTLPHFKKGEMYKGMELNKFYTSEELGL